MLSALRYYWIQFRYRKGSPLKTVDVAVADMTIVEKPLNPENGRSIDAETDAS